MAARQDREPCSRDSCTATVNPETQAYLGMESGAEYIYHSKACLRKAVAALATRDDFDPELGDDSFAYCGRRGCTSHFLFEDNDIPIGWFILDFKPRGATGDVFCSLPCLKTALNVQA
jgi:hypothetical protein